MRILLDESVPRRLGRELLGHRVSTVAQRGWDGQKNGDLLALAAADLFDVLITADQNMEFQRNLLQLPVAIVVLIAQNNSLPALRKLVPQLLAALAVLQPCTLIHVRA